MTKKTLGYLAAAAIVAIGLSGCFRLTQEITLHEDNTASGVFVVAFQEEFANEDLSQLTGGTDPGEAFDGAVVSDYNQDGYVGTKVEFSNQPIATVSEDSEWSITREGDDFIVKGSLGDSEQFFEGAEVWLSITFPGPVSEHNGTLDGNTVTWDASEGQFDISAVGSAVGGGGGGIPSIVWIVLLLVIIGGVAAFLVLNNRKSGDAGETPAAS